jgi:hypothetical protein
LHTAERNNERIGGYFAARIEGMKEHLALRKKEKGKIYGG